MSATEPCGQIFLTGDDCGAGTGRSGLTAVLPGIGAGAAWGLYRQAGGRGGTG